MNFTRFDLAEQADPAFSRKNFIPHDVHMERQIMPRAVTSINGPTDWNEALDIICFGSPEQSVEGMKVVCHELAQATGDPEGSLMNELVKDADRLVSCLASKVAKTFDFSLTGASSRSCNTFFIHLCRHFKIKDLLMLLKRALWTV
ncbi:protein MOR1-like [Euphorbia lathyris]|uniref:protein MOR1-like n=1 Tax=Euphorbia lathyris TaxID=212925 RepID=UPI0033135945